VAHIGARSVAVVGVGLDQQRDAPRPVGLVEHRLDRLCVGARARALRDRALDVVLGIDASFAFWTAFASAAFASTSPPPSRAATVIAARAS